MEKVESWSFPENDQRHKGNKTEGNHHAQSSTADPKRVLMNNIGRAIVKKLEVRLEGNEILGEDNFNVFACY